MSDEDANSDFSDEFIKKQVEILKNLSEMFKNAVYSFGYYSLSTIFLNYFVKSFFNVAFKWNYYAYISEKWLIKYTFNDIFYLTLITPLPTSQKDFEGLTFLS